MRNIMSKSCTGPEAVRIVLIETWMKECKIRDSVEDYAQIVLDARGGFNHFHDQEIGGSILDAVDLVSQFFAFLDSHPMLCKVGDYDYVKIKGNPNFVLAYLANDLGAALKKTKWWEKNLQTLNKYKNNLKVVRKVMST